MMLSQSFVYCLIILIFNVLYICDAQTNLTCIGKQKCKDDELKCNPAQPCTLTCDGGKDGQSCQKVTLNGTHATNVTVYCKGKQDCDEMTVYCGTGDCHIECEAEQSCKLQEVTCGYGHCSVQCESDSSCDGIDINTDAASSFICHGDKDYCPKKPLPFTSSPTVDPTNQPTIHPTTVQPTHTDATTIQTAIQTSSNTQISTNDTYGVQMYLSFIYNDTQQNVDAALFDTEKILKNIIDDKIKNNRICIPFRYNISTLYLRRYQIMSNGTIFVCTENDEFRLINRLALELEDDIISQSSDSFQILRIINTSFTPIIGSVVRFDTTRTSVIVTDNDMDDDLIEEDNGKESNKIMYIIYFFVADVLFLIVLICLYKSYKKWDQWKYDKQRGEQDDIWIFEMTAKNKNIDNESTVCLKTTNTSNDEGECIEETEGNEMENEIIAETATEMLTVGSDGDRSRQHTLEEIYNDIICTNKHTLSLSVTMAKYTPSESARNRFMIHNASEDES